jgi:thiosulfate/3-mercaptopyruvate sulfurtransferase
LGSISGERRLDTDMATMTTPQLLDALGDDEVRLIDVRPVDAYNGWRLRNEPRGGHIQGAKSLPETWTGYLDWLDVVKGKRLAPEHKLVLYGYVSDETDRVAGLFTRAGYADVHVYRGFCEEWSADPQLPMDRLPRYRHLVSPHWVDTLLRTGAAAEHDHADYVVCHAHYQNRGAYDEGHIPGAIALDTNSLESPDTWNRRPPGELKQTLEAMGIAHDTTVVLYGRDAFPDNNDPFPGSSAGQLAALRCAFILLYAGVEDVRVLNGGLQAWLDAGLPTTTEPTRDRPPVDFGVAIPQRPELAVDLPEAKAMLRAADANLVSVRSWREFIGEVSGYNYVDKCGRIPGAVFGNCGSDAYHMENYRNFDHTMREYHEIEDIWAAAGITPDKHNAFYCGTGWRGSEAFFNAWLMAWPRISVFDGGWFEWSRDEDNPFETGVPPGRQPGGARSPTATRLYIARGYTTAQRRHR